MKPLRMITNRSIQASGPGGERTAELTYWKHAGGGAPVDQFSSWQLLTEREFARDLATDTTDLIGAVIHGYNQGWHEGAALAELVQRTVFGGGPVILISWPSDGRATRYLRDRRDARASAASIAEAFIGLYEWQRARARSGQACEAAVSVVAHSMGGYVVQNALRDAWEDLNRVRLPVLQQLVFVGADVADDLWDKPDGRAIDSLVYRTTNLYSGLDSVLGLSVAKHGGSRRIGRSGYSAHHPTPPSAHQVDCSALFAGYKDSVHSAYFHVSATQKLMADLVRGVDRMQLAAAY